MDHVAEQEIKDGDRVDAVENECTVIEKEPSTCFLIGIGAEAGNVIIYDVTEEIVEGNTKYPSQQDLIIGVHAVINPTESNHEACE